MPYLTDQRKFDIDNNPKQPLVGAGDLTYVLTRIALDTPSDDISDAVFGAIKRYMPRQPHYENYAIVLGCLDSTRREISRRENSQSPGRREQIGKAHHLLALFSHSYYRNVVAPYEDTKIEQNGDVF